MSRIETIGNATLYLGDCRETLRTLPDASIDSVVTDPPYELGFMGKAWDGTGIANDVGMWREVLRVLKPGAHLLAFSGSRTYHRMVCAIEDAGFEIRDQIMWLYGSGFPKSLDVSKAIDKAAGAERDVTREGQTKAPEDAGKFDSAPSAARERRDEPATEAARQWQGWGTALKPAHEPIVVARKPLIGTVAANVLAHGTGALNIDGCRVGLDGDYKSKANGRPSQTGLGDNYDPTAANQPDTLGRWPANVIHDGSDEVLAAFPQTASNSGNLTHKAGVQGVAFGKYGETPTKGITDSGSAARFFYCAKASRADRNAGCKHMDRKPLNWSSGTQNPGSFQGEGTDKTSPNNHPTVKPTALMRYLVRLVTPPGGTVLDPFTGSGSTGRACALEGMQFIGCELDPAYVAIANARIADARREAEQERRKADAIDRQPRLIA